MTDRSILVRLRMEISDYQAKSAKAAEATSQIGAAGERAGSTVSRGLQQAGQAAGQLIAVAGTATTALLASALKTGAAYNTLQQTSRAAFTTILGSAEAASGMMEKLNAFTAGSPFGKDIFIKGAQQLLSFGMEAEKVIPTLGSIQDAVAATGGSGQQLSELVYVLAQIRAAGKVTAVDLMQFGQRGVDAASLIGSEMGKTGAEIRGMITKGELSADQAIDNLVTGMSKKFGGSADLVKNTWVGATDRIKAAWRDVSSEITQPFIKREGGGLGLEWANQFADLLRAVQGQAGDFSRMMVSVAAPAIARFEAGIRGATAAVKGFDFARIPEQFERLRSQVPVLAGITSSLAAMGTQLPILQRLGLSINPMVAGIAALVATSPELRQVGSTLISSLGPSVEMMGQVSVVVLKTANDIVRHLAPGLNAVAAAAGPVANVLAQMLVPAIMALADAAIPIADVLSNLLTVIAQIPAPILASVAAFAMLRSPVMSAAGALMKFASPIATTTKAMVDQAVAISRANVAFTNVGASGRVAAAEFRKMASTLQGIRTEAQNSATAISATSSSLAQSATAMTNTVEAGKRMRNTIQSVTYDFGAVNNAAGSSAQAMKNVGGAFSQAESAASGLSAKSKNLASDVGFAGSAMRDLNTIGSSSAQAFTRTSAAVNNSAASLSSMAGASALTGAAVNASTTSLSAMGRVSMVAGTAARVAGGAVTSLGVAMKAAFLSNPLTIALAALTTALGVMASASASAKARVDMYAEAVDKTTGKVDRLSQKQKTYNAIITGENADWGWWQKQRTGWDSIAEGLEAVGSSSKEMTEAVHGTQSEFDAYIAKLNKIYEQRGFDVGTNELIIKTHQLRDGLKGGTEQGQKLAQAERDLADAGSTTSQQLAKQNDLLKKNAEMKEKQRDAAFSLREAELRTQQQVVSFNDALAERQKVLETSGKASREYQDAQFRVSEQLNATGSAYKNEIDLLVKSKAGKEEISRRTQEYRDALIGQAESTGMASGEAKKLADELNLVPKNVTSRITVDTKAAIGEAKTIGDLLNAMGQDISTWLISADGTQAVDTANGTVIAIDEKTGTVKILGNDDPAIKELEGAVTNINGTTGVLKIAGDSAQAETERQKIYNAVISSNPVMRIKADTSEAEGVIQAFMNLQRTAWVNLKTRIENVPGVGYHDSRGRGTQLKYAAGGLIHGLASGGWVPGDPPQDKRHDNLLGLVNGMVVGLQSGEFVSNAQSVAMNANALEAGNDGARLMVADPGTQTGWGSPNFDYTPYQVPAASSVPASSQTVVVQRPIDGPVVFSVDGRQFAGYVQGLASDVTSEALAEEARAAGLSRSTGRGFRA